MPASWFRLWALSCVHYNKVCRVFFFKAKAVIWACLEIGLVSWGDVNLYNPHGALQAQCIQCQCGCWTTKKNPNAYPRHLLLTLQMQADSGKVKSCSRKWSVRHMEKWIKNERPWLQMPSDTRGNAINAPVGLTRGWARFLQAPRHKKITMKVALGGEVCFPCNK